VGWGTSCALVAVFAAHDRAAPELLVLFEGLTNRGEWIRAAAVESDDGGTLAGCGWWAPVPGRRRFERARRLRVDPALAERGGDDALGFGPVEPVLLDEPGGCLGAGGLVHRLVETGRGDQPCSAGVDIGADAIGEGALLRVSCRRDAAPESASASWVRQVGRHRVGGPMPAVRGDAPLGVRPLYAIGLDQPLRRLDPVGFCSARSISPLATSQVAPSGNTSPTRSM